MTLLGNKPLAYAQLSVTSATSLAAASGGVATPAGTTRVQLSVEGNGIRYRDDGTNPTSSVGMPVAAGGSVDYDGDLSALRVVSQTGTATVNVVYYAKRR